MKTLHTSVPLSVTFVMVAGLFFAQNLWPLLSAQVSGAAVIVTAPDSGVSWKVGETHDITWTTAGLPGDAKVGILMELLSSSSGIPRSLGIASGNSVLASAGSYSWTIPSSKAYGINSYAGYQIKIRVYTVGSNGVVGRSNFFTLVDATAGQSIAVTAPVGGETWKVGETKNITWTATGFPGDAKVGIVMNLTSPSGNRSLQIAPGNSVLASAGTYAWTIPSSKAYGINSYAGYQMKVLVAVTSGVSGSSNSFTLVDASPASSVASSAGVASSISSVRSSASSAFSSVAVSSYSSVASCRQLLCQAPTANCRYLNPVFTNGCRTGCGPLTCGSSSRSSAPVNSFESLLCSAGCNNWDLCIRGVQTRVCHDTANKCPKGSTLTESRSCSPSVAPPYSCTETDAGLDYFTAGEATTTDVSVLYSVDKCRVSPASGHFCSPDVCVGDTLYEKFCNPSGTIGYHMVRCIDGCARGACVRGSFSDAMQNPSVSSSCRSNWSCSNWSVCTSDKKHARNCTDLNKCGDSATKPVESETCRPEYNNLAISLGDTDAGKDFYTFGKVRYVNTSSAYTEKPDFCFGDYLYEQYNFEDYRGGRPYLHSQIFHCPDGCQNGACIKGSQYRAAQNPTMDPSCVSQWYCSDWSLCINGRQTRTCDDWAKCASTPKPEESHPCSNAVCTDSDGGLDYYKKGTTQDHTGPTGHDSRTDSCYLGKVYEWYCGASGASTNTTYICPKGCEKGACKR